MGRRSYDMGDTEAGYVDYEHQRLERIKVVDSPGRTDIRYRVVR